MNPEVTIKCSDEENLQENERRHKNIERLIEIGRQIQENIPKPPLFDR